jgi:ABC-type multidrug transport system fused ATPase/permease subunit
MDKGQIIEEGNHKSLMEQDGAYKALVNLQRL